MHCNLHIIDLPEMDEKELRDFAFRRYKDLYLDRGHIGILEAHDGQEVFFFERQFEHAFMTSSDRTRRPYAKDVLAGERVIRMSWIGPIVRGEVPETACFIHWKAAMGVGDFNRYYIHYPEMHLIWLEPRQNGGWKFSSAYKTTRGDLRRYGQTSKRIWMYPKKNAP